MSNFQLNLPTDIPWERICVSNDMIDSKICDRKTPKRWRSSIAVFKYEPEEEFQNYEGLTLSYLKVTCSITGYQEDPNEIGLKPKGFWDYWKSQAGINNYLDILQKYYPCYGAILEVAVAPKDGKVPTDKFPYFMDFSPKKRELYELVSETGETLSRSLSNLEVGKSNTSLRSHEVMDIDKGFSASGSVGVGETSISGSYSKQQEKGSRSINQDQAQNLRNTNTSQEMRELQSHTTQLSQMYHQLDSYHLGTNRGVFFIHPRPHTIQTEHTFVNGPRNIEGIQEFMFVVARPKDTGDFCVEAYLETGHIGKVPITQKQTKTDIVGLSVFENFDGKSGDDLDINNSDNSETRFKTGQTFYTPPPGWDIVSHGAITRNINIRVSECNVSEWDANHLILSGRVSARFQDDFGDNKVFPGHLDAVLTVTLEEQVPRVVENEDVLFITGRGLCCCDPKFAVVPGIVYERPVSNAKPHLSRSHASVPSDKMSILAANKMGETLKDAILKSRNDVVNRYSEGGINLPQSSFANKALVASIQSDARERISTLENLSEDLKAKVLEFNPNLSVRALLEMPLEMQKDLFDLDQEEVIELRNSLTGFNHEVKDKKLAWLTPKQRANYLDQGRRK